MSPVDLLFSVDQAQLFKVEDNKQRLLEQGKLVIQYTKGSDFDNLTAQVNAVSWLLDQSTAALKVSKTVYSFAFNGHAEFYYILMLPDGYTEEILESLASILQSSTVFHVSETVPAIAHEAQTEKEKEEGKQTENEMAKKIEEGGHWAGKAIMTAGAYTAKGLANAADYAVKKMTPADKPVEVSKKTQERVHQAATAVSYMAAATTVVAGKAGELLAAGARRIAPKVLPESMQRSDSSTMQVAAASFKSFMHVWEALEDAAVVVLNESADGTTRVLSHKYGEQVGAVSKEGSHIVRDGFVAYASVKRLTIKGMAKAGGVALTHHVLAPTGPVASTSSRTVSTPALPRLTAAEVERTPSAPPAARLAPAKHA